jgi:[ribosomal protein S5]-alanine N-acetyltransferase
MIRSDGPWGPRLRSRAMAPATLIGRRIVLRPLVPEDFPQWREVRRRNREWLTRWEPSRIPGSPDVVEDRNAFVLRCHARDRERQLGTGYGFGVFVASTFAGEINLSSVQRGPFQSAYLGYWIDERHAGHGYTPEAVVLTCRYAFEDLRLHRVQISIIPRNRSSRRVVEKLGIRDEGVAIRYLEINGAWEDHIRFAITAEEWADRREVLTRDWIS